MPDANATQSYVLAQLQARPITAASLISALLAIIGLVAGVTGATLVGGSTVTVLPTATNASIYLAPGQSATLPVGAPIGTFDFVGDNTQGVAGGPCIVAPLSQPETVNAPSDATIAGASTYPLTLACQGVTFRKATASTWQPQ